MGVLEPRTAAAVDSGELAVQFDVADRAPSFAGLGFGALVAGGRGVPDVKRCGVAWFGGLGERGMRCEWHALRLSVSMKMSWRSDLVWLCCCAVLRRGTREFYMCVQGSSEIGLLPGGMDGAWFGGRATRVAGARSTGIVNVRRFFVAMSRDQLITKERHRQRSEAKRSNRVFANETVIHCVMDVIKM